MKKGKIIFIFALLFFLAEVSCRMLMPSYVKIIDNKTHKRIWLSDVIESSQKGKRFKPNLDLVVYNAWISHKPRITLKTNSLGLRGQEPAGGSGGLNSYNIVVLGDSITWAGYLPEEETYVMQLKTLLKEYTGREIHAINAGIGDVGIEEELLLLEEIYGKTQPQLVILAFYLNDSRPSLGFESEKKLSWAKFLQKSRFLDFLYNLSRVQLFLMRNKVMGKNYRYRWFYLAQDPRWKSDRGYFDAMVKEADLDWGAAWEEGPWGKIENKIQEFKKISEEKKFKLLIACLPVSFQVYADFLDDYPQKKLMEISAKLGIAFLDLLPKLRDQNRLNLFYDHCHLNVEGQRIVAQELASAVTKHKLIPR